MATVLHHLLVELTGCPAAALDDLERVRGALREAAALANTSLLSDALHKFHPSGVTGIALLSESHVSIHTWPERGVAACDLLTCGPSGGLDRVAAALRATFSAARVTARVIERSLP